MKAFAAVALREVAERRFVLVAAAAAAVVPFLVPLLPGVPGDQAVLTRGIVALVLASAFGLGGSLLVGASVVGRELAERRLSFHFSRPIPAAVVWGGKLVGGLALVLLAELIVFLPASAASGAFPGLPGMSLDGVVLWAILLCAVPFFLLAWVGSVALRSRSPWLVVDLVLVVAAPQLLFVIGRRLMRYGHGPEPSWAFVSVGVLLMALLAATLAQVVAGRTDARRGHGAQSLALWGVLLAALAAGSLWAERTIDPGVARLVRASAEPAGAGGEWVFVEGSARKDGGGSSFYLLNLRTGRSVLLPAGWMATASADGSRAVGVHGIDLLEKKVVLDAIDLKSGENVSLDLPDWPQGIDLTADGRRLAVVSGGICRVVELPSFRLLASARVPSSAWAYEPHFASPDSVRLHPRRNWRRAPDGSALPANAVDDPEAAELNVGAKSVTTLARYPVSSIPIPPRKSEGAEPRPVYILLPSPDFSRVLALGLGAARGARLLDASTGRVLASIDGSDEAGRPLGTFLADGRVVVAEPVPEGCRLVLLSPDGSRLSEIALPAGTARVRFGFEPARGLLGVALARDSRSDEWEWSLVDLESGRIRPLGARGVPREWWSDTQSVPPPGSPATRLAWEKATGRLVLYDPATGAQTPITRGRPAGK
jgi:hypothetical protein